MVKLCHAVCADLFDRCLQISLRKAIRLQFRHFIFFGALIIHFVHPFHNAVKYLLLARIVLIQGTLGDSQFLGNVAHRSSQISALCKKFKRGFQNALFGISGHNITP